jgi:uncharacterized repeat protein (TIGR02543 family)
MRSQISTQNFYRFTLPQNLNTRISLLLLSLCFFGGAWGQTIIITNASIGGSAVLGSSNYNSGLERTWTQGSVDFGGKAITCNISGTPSGSSACQYIQTQASNGVIYNTTALPGRLISVQFIGTASVATSCFGGNSRLVNSTTGNYTVGGTQIGSQQTNTNYTWSTNTNENYSFFCLKRGSTAQYFSSIVITYQLPTTVTFNSNYGTATTLTQTAGFPTNLTLNSFTKSGYTFSGWNTLSDGTGTSYSDGASYSFSSSTTLYAQWTCNSGTYTGASGGNWSTGLNWCGGSVPTSASNVTIPSGVTVILDAATTVANLTIDGTLEVAANNQLTLTGTLTNNGTMTIESGATFKQGTSVTGTGTYNVKQTIDNGAVSGSTLSGRFWYLGSPLACTRSSSFGTAGSLNKVWEFTNGAYANVADATALTPTKGYVHRRSDASTTLTFSGQNLYAQDATLSLSNNAGSYAGWHLVSNPYTAYLDWNQIVSNSTGMSNTYYIRSYNSNNQDVDALISYNASSGLESNTSSFALGNTGSTTAQYIAPLQAFWVKVPPTSTLSSTAGQLNLQRAFTSHQTGNIGLKNTGVYPVLARVNLHNGAMYDQALIYMNEFMTNSSDQNDSEKMFVSGVASIYTMASGKKLVMNGLKNNKKKISVPLYLELPTSKVYQLQLSEYIMEDGLILLEDKQEGTIQDFTINDTYAFYANSGVLSNRFVLHFYMPDAGVSAQGPSNSWVEEESVINEGGSILVSSNGRGKVTINQDIDATPSEKGSVVVRDAAGREIYNGQLTGSATNLELDAPSGIYFVSVELNGQVEVKKIFVQQ